MPNGNQTSVNPKARDQYVASLFVAAKQSKPEGFQNAFWKAYHLGLAANPQNNLVRVYKATTALRAREAAWPGWEKL